MTKRDRFAFNSPPSAEEAGGWCWLTREMLESPAWAAMSIAARKVVDRLLIEHMAHAGTMNGELIVTYDDFVAYGVRRQSVRPAIDEAIGLGWVDRTVKGVKSYGAARRPSQYGLTWMGRRDRTPPSNRWRAAVPSRDIDSSTASGTGATSQKAAIASVENGTGGVPETVLGNSRKRYWGNGRRVLTNGA